jgi:hypothetical protein
MLILIEAMLNSNRHLTPAIRVSLKNSPRGRPALQNHLLRFSPDALLL